MDHSQRTSHGDSSSNATAGASNMMPNVLFREIHKNAYLKRHSSDRRTGFPRKSEKVWVVFCVHDDVEAFLEIYPDQKMALAHKPEWFASLANALHVSPSICGHEDEFEFAVTLTSQVVRLAAPSWESMMEWVETIRNKLRELKVLSPKENIYTKMPEQRQLLLPTRDPNSPLPLPPEGPSTLLPGVEPVHLDSRNIVADANEPTRHQRDVLRNNVNDRRVRQDNAVEINNQTEAVENQREAQNNNTSGEVLVNRSRHLLSRAISVPESPTSHSSVVISSSVPNDSNVTVIEVGSSNNRGSHSASESGYFNFTVSGDACGESEIDDIFCTPPVTPRPEADQNGEAHYEHVFLPNTSVIEQRVIVNENKVKTSETNNISDAGNANSSHENDQPCSSSSLNGVNISTNDIKPVVVNHNSLQDEVKSEAGGCISLQTQSKLEKVNIPGLIPRVPAKSSKHDPGKRSESKKSETGNQNHQPSKELIRPLVRDDERNKNLPSSSASPLYSQVKKLTKIKVGESSSRSQEQAEVASPVLPRRKPNENVKPELELQNRPKPEVVPHSSKDIAKVNMIAPKEKKPKQVNINKTEPPVNQSSANVSNNQYRAEISNSTPSTSGNSRDGNINRIPKQEGVNNHNNNVDVEPLTATVQPAVGGVITVEDIPLIGGHQRRRRRSSSSDAGTASTTPPSRGIAGADRIRVNLPLTGALPVREAQRNDGDRRPSGDSRYETEANSHISAQPSSRLTLREQQVLQLRKEMMHPGGVRLQLRRKDCIGSIALVDVLSGVWIAGWKQKEHPMLYNALHIGDQLISVSDVVVRSSGEAQKLIRTSASLYIEFIIRRVPFGRVFALQRSSEGQNLGIVQEGNTAEIKDVLPNSVAARQGLSGKTPSCDGLSLTNWFLTEINGRPLNLFFKDNEVRDRLNAVGKEISILVQPHDFIKQIKKHLKSIRSYKDYIVQ